MSLKVLKYDFVEGTARILKEAQFASQSNEVSFELSHSILSQAPCAEADTLAEGANPLLTVVTMTKVLFVVSLKTK